MDKIQLERSVAYKKKDNGIDKRNMRAHRRSIEWKQMRDKTVSQKRGAIASPLSPLKEVNRNELPKTKEPKKNITAAESRKDKLLKWRQEKELKKKIEAQERAKKKPFKVSHIETATLPFRKTAATITAPVKNKVETKATKVAPTRTTNTKSSATTKPVSRTSAALPKQEPARRTTRSKPEVQPVARPAAAKPVAKGRPVPKMPPPAKKTTAAKGKTDTKIARGKSAGTKNSETKNKSPVRPVPMPNRKVMDSVTKTRGARISSSTDYSFAPQDFQFTAPSRLQSFIFQPLSPSSAATFMCPNKDMTAVFSPPSTRRCSTPKLISNNPSRIRQSPHASAITEIISGTSGSSDSEPEKGATNSVRSPVMKLVNQAANSEDAESKVVKSGRKVRKSTRASNVTVEKVKENENIEPQKVDAQKSAEPAENKEKAAEDIPMEEDKPKENTEKTDEKVTQKKTPAKRKSTGINEKKALNTKTQSLQEEILCGYPQDTENCENIAPSADDVFLTPSHTVPRRQRTRSLGTAMLLKNSAKRFKTPKNNRNSLILRALSPEEGIEVLKHSPMIEMTRRTPKNLNTTSKSESAVVDPLPTFDDIEEELKEAERSFSQQMQGECVSDKELTSAGSVSEETGDAPSAAPVNVETSDAPVKDTDNKEVTENTEAAVPENSTEVPHDVNYFKNLMLTEIDSIKVFCDKWDKYNEDNSDLSEEAQGHIRTATGKGQLLIKERFKKQFTGLIADCEFKTGFKETTCQDLQGFWEMVYFQVEDVYNMFKDLDKRRANNWQEDQPQVVKKKVVKKKPAAAKSTKPAAKSGFAAFRAKMKQKQQEPVTENASQVPEPTSTMTFDGGFFNVNSPVKTTVTAHCEGGTPTKPLQPKKALYRFNTPSRSPLLVALLSRSARKSTHGPSPLLFDAMTQQQALAAAASPAIIPKSSPDSSKRKRTATNSTSGSESSTPAKMSRLDSSACIPDSIFTPEQDTRCTNKRQSLRRSIRKSVSWNPTEVEEETNPNIMSCGKESNLSFSKFLIPSSSEPLTDEAAPASAMDVDPLSPDDVDMAAQSKRTLRTEFDQHSNSAKKVATTCALRRLSSNEKSLSGRRKSRRSVHFSFSKQSPPPSASSAKMPVTPFNKDSLVPRTRRSSQNCSAVDSVLFTPPPTKPVAQHTPAVISPLRTASHDTPSTRMAQLKMGDNTPVDSPRRKSTRNTRRISGFTPPETVSAKAPALHSVSEDPITDLMSFSPATDASKGTPRRSRRLTRQSLL